MSLQKRALAALSAVLMAFLIAVGGTQTALASDSASDSTRVTSISDDGQKLRSAWSVDAGAGILANPGVSPAPERTFSNRTVAQAIRLVNTCPSGTFCTYQQQDNGEYRAYYFYECGDYQLSNWSDSRWSYNHQTGGVTVRLLGSNGNQVNTVTAGQKKAVNWDPVWTIRLCG